MAGGADRLAGYHVVETLVGIQVDVVELAKLLAADMMEVIRKEAEQANQLVCSFAKKTKRKMLD